MIEMHAVPVVISGMVHIHGEVAALGAGMVTHSDTAELTEVPATLMHDTPAPVSSDTRHRT